MNDPAAEPRLIVVFLRGAADGLNMVVPHGDPDYYARRPGIAIAAPGSAAEPAPSPLPIPLPGLTGSGQVALDLDGFFGLHPALAPLMPAFEAGELALVQATGAPQADRSHFSSQARMEVGGTADSRATGGWLGRYLNATAARRGQAVRAVSVDVALDLSLAGAASAIAVANNADYQLHTATPAAWRAALPRLHADAGFRFDGVQAQIFSALDLFAEARPQDLETDPAAAYPADALGGRLRQAAQYIKAEMGIDAITLNSGGWDHHVGENTALPPLLDSLARGLAALRTDLGPHWDDTVVVLMSEFGRTVDENASGGTDHGRASMMMVLGGSVLGGRVYGRWPGLDDASLDPAGDLAITTDYRSVLAEVLQRHMRLQTADLDRVFPGFTTPETLGLMA